ncbi:MAG: hypothetical protein RML72_05210 [Bacteroidia bacterium]|nr:hypothetical protein [Bacteroidia bacterium]MDW8158263.1 hypothetical protein [Bacteroidia bacterium]
MSVLIVIFFALSLGIKAWGAFQEKGALSAEQYKKLFFAQILRTCQKKKLLYQKTVVSKWGAKQSRESKNLTLVNCKCSVSQQDTLSLSKETALAVQFLFNDPYINSYFITSVKSSVKENIWRAEIKKEYFEKSELKAQVLQMQERVLRRITSWYSRSSFLYQLQTSITVYFSEQGLYQRHIIEVEVAIPFLETQFKTIVTGRALFF